VGESPVERPWRFRYSPDSGESRESQRGIFTLEVFTLEEEKHDMKLYYTPGACSLSPHIALREAGLSFDLEKVDLQTKKTEKGGDFKQINPKGYVPVLELDDGQRLTEGPAIVQYIADRKPESGLAPKAGALERYRLQEWLNFIGTELHKTFGALFNPAITPDWKRATLERADQRLGWLAEQLEGKQYLLGDRFTVADGYLFTVLNWGPHLKIDIGQRAALKDYQARVGSRPKVQEALKAEGLAR
jgi:glutathione S-transferase